MTNNTTPTVTTPRRTASAHQLEERFGMSREFWRRLSAAGKLDAYRISSRRVVYDLDQAEAYIAASRVSVATAEVAPCPA